MPKPASQSVLIIDDDAALRRSIVAYLQDSGYQVHEAASGREGLQLFAKIKPDLVLTDLMMPELDGLGVVTAIRQTSPDTPVVIISGNGSVSYAIETVRQGAWDYITKPIHDFTTLEQVIDKVNERVTEINAQRNREAELERSVTDSALKLQQLRSCDPLTGLPMRQQLRELFDAFVRRGDLPHDLFVILLDLDNLKSINKTFGHEYGDLLLVDTAHRLRQHESATVTVGRLGADQFVILLTGCSEVHGCIQELRQVLARPFRLLDEEVFITACLGIAAFPHDGESLDSLLQHANAALSQAKLLGSDKYAFYSSGLSERLRERMSRETSLHRALERNEFFLDYQPKVTAGSWRICGVEALLRWKPHHQQAVVQPNDFIPILEESGLIIEVGRWVLETACRQLMAWQQPNDAPLQLSVNISAVQFHAGDLPELVESVIVATGIEPERLCLELTESVVMQDSELAMATLQRLRQLGVMLSIDDFGTGFASLNYLQRMQLNELKIDRSFVKHLPNDKNAMAIINSVLSLAESLSLTVVAEGVETSEQASFLADLGCHQLQGFYFSRPLTPHGIQELILPLP
ncbi:putative bifunctional diguanylate cyclase/phosphodiesterase [Trichlorobacter sp.]|uniref:putative bifunctional diguanylate cyclase/phosphodiesterase n=1 Tax=Trichlorobacter sp. TaxID=2911007 RepID=UPI002A37133E|nr:EAL domain-containing protein [Trichlorobacter sp.]MDY0384675.1 EAL domain-containing protein [Trichlorobacter sp.]